MELLTPFVFGVGVFDLSEHLPHLRDLFVKNKKKMSAASNTRGLNTTLLSYAPGVKIADCLDNSVGGNSLRATIELVAKEYAAGCSYKTDGYTPEVSGAWINEMVSGGVHPGHNHPGKTFAGCIYIDMPPNAPGIKFTSPRSRFDYSGLDIAQFTPLNSQMWELTPGEGQLYIWESWLYHGVEDSAAGFEGVRRSMAFDVIMKPI